MRFSLDIPTVVADVAEDLVVTKLLQSDLDPIAMGSEVLEGVETLPEKPVRLPEFGSVFTPGIATFLDALAERTADERGGGIPPTIFSGHVVLSAIRQSWWCYQRAWH